MSFGVGEALEISKLAYGLYTKCEAAPAEFRAASTQANMMHLVLDEINDAWHDLPRTSAQERRLKELCGGCRDVLVRLDATLEKRKSLGTGELAVRDRVRWDASSVLELRQQLSEHNSLLTTFQSSLISSSQGQVLSSQSEIQQKLDQLIRDVQNGRTNARDVTAAVDSSDHQGSNPRELTGILNGYNISAQDVSEHRQFIQAFFKDALADGRLQVAVDHQHRSAPGEAGRSQAAWQARLPTAMPKRTHALQILLAFVPCLICFQSKIGASLDRKDHRSLQNAIEMNDIARARRQLDKGASAGWLETQDFHGLHVSAKNNWIDMAKLLIRDGIPVDVQDKLGARPIHVACENGNGEIAELFLQIDSTQITKHDYSGRTPLHAASGSAAGRSVRLIRRLLDRGAEIDARDDDNETALLTLFKAVVRSGADPESQEAKGWKQSDMEVVRLLLQRGARKDVRGDSGKTAAEYLVLRPDSRVSDLLSHA